VNDEKKTFLYFSYRLAMIGDHQKIGSWASGYSEGQKTWKNEGSIGRLINKTKRYGPAIYKREYWETVEIEGKTGKNTGGANFSIRKTIVHLRVGLSGREYSPQGRGENRGGKRRKKGRRTVRRKGIPSSERGKGWGQSRGRPGPPKTGRLKRGKGAKSAAGKR